MSRPGADDFYKQPQTITARVTEINPQIKGRFVSSLACPNLANSVKLLMRNTKDPLLCVVNRAAASAGLDRERTLVHNFGEDSTWRHCIYILVYFVCRNTLL